MPGQLAAVFLLLGIGMPAGWSQPAAKPAEMRKIKFDARGLPWPKVFQWLTRETGKPVISNYTKDMKGSFNVRVPEGATYTLLETVDLLNEALMEEGYLLIHKPHSFTLIPAELKVGGFPAQTIPVEELDGRGSTELVRVMFRLKNIPAEDLLPHMRPMLSKFGEINVIKNGLIIEDLAGNLRRIYLVIQELEAGGGFLVDRKGSSIKPSNNLLDALNLHGDCETSHTCTRLAIPMTMLV
jgi:type II secretory pathway component GspD/PulD (secretin)